MLLLARPHSPFVALSRSLAAARTLFHHRRSVAGNGNDGDRDAVDPRLWIGHKRELRDVVNPGRVSCMSATLSACKTRELNPEIGDVVPPPWHWSLFTHEQAVPPNQLGEDGFLKPGEFLPRAALPHLLWGGCSMSFYHPIHVGDPLRRVDTVVSVEPKQGRTGKLLLVGVRQETFHETTGAQLMGEKQDFVFQGGNGKAWKMMPEGPRAPLTSDLAITIVPDPILLFRFSALTFNAHRIHYDRPYAVEVEGYPGLMVHGELTATLLLDIVRRLKPAGATLTHFECRAIRPLFDTTPFVVAGKVSQHGQCEVWASPVTDEKNGAGIVPPMAMRGWALFE